MALQEVCGGPYTSEHAASRADLTVVPNADIEPSKGVQVTPLLFARRLQEFRQREREAHLTPATPPQRSVWTTESDEKTWPLRQMRGTVVTTSAVPYARTPVHDTIAEELAQRPADFPSIVKNLRWDPSQMYPGQLLGDVAETHVDHAWEEIAEANGLKGLIETAPKNTWHFRGYTFIREGGGGITIHNKRRGTYHGEIDNFALVNTKDGVVPTISEVKAHNRIHGGKRVDLFLRRGTLDRVHGVLGDIFEASPAVMLIATKGSINPDSPEINRFEDKGGYVVYMQPRLSKLSDYANRIHRQVATPQHELAVG